MRGPCMKVRRSSILIGFVALAGLLHGVLGAETGDAVFSPAYFWMWNGRLDAKELCSQLEDMHAHGLRNVCIHPFPKGFRDWFPTEMAPDYLTDGYLDVFTKVVRRAGELVAPPAAFGPECFPVPPAALSRASQLVGYAPFPSAPW